MAQRVQTVPNPRYQTAPLETTGATIVSGRRVMVPPFTQAIFKGIQDYSGSVYNYITFQIADNESFLDNKCLFLIFDLTVYGPNAGDIGGNAANNRPFGRDLDIVFDQSSSALITQLTIGSPQGLKFEELMNYNMYGNIVALHTQPRANKNSHLLNWTEWTKDNDQDYGLQHFTDQQWSQPCRVKIGEKTRMAMRLDFSDFMQNIDLFPLFLLRNGLQIILYLENAYKVFYSPHGNSRARDIVLQSTFPNPDADAPPTFQPPYLIGPGAYNLGANNDFTLNTPIIAVNTAGANYYVPSGFVNGAYNSTSAIVPSFNTLWLPYNLAEGLYAQLPSGWDRTTACFIPISFYELNQIVWSGFLKFDQIGASLDTSFANPQFSELLRPAGVATAQDQWGTGATNANPLATLLGALSTQVVYTLSATAYTEATQDAAENTAAGLVPQLDVDKRPDSNWTSGTQPYATIAFSRYNTAAGAVDPSANPQMVGFPIFSFHDAQFIPYVNFQPSVTTAIIAEAMNNIILRGGKCIIHIGDAIPVIFRGTGGGIFTYGNATAGGVVTAPNGSLFDVVNPALNGAASVLSLWNLPRESRTMRYQVENPQLLLDLIKPGAQEFQQWQQAFSSPSGIPIKYKKPIYRKLNFPNQVSGLLQIQVPINVRSLTGIFFVIQDPSLDIPPNDLLNSLMLANLSTFQNRRLTEQYIQIGGQQYPVYMYQMRPDGTNIPYWEAHILEAEKFFSVAGTASFNCSLSRPMIKKTRNMLAGGYLGSSQPLNRSNLSHTQRCTYTDASGCVYSMNIAKDWVRPFTTGIDSSQSASIALNLYFKELSAVGNVSTAFGSGNSSNTGSTGNRSFNIHMFAMCDAVATLQESANLVRY